MAPSTLASNTGRSVLEYRSSSPLILAVAASLTRSVAPLASSSGVYWALLTRVSNCCSCLTSPEHSPGARRGLPLDRVVRPHQRLEPVKAHELGLHRDRVLPAAVDLGVQRAPDL